MAVKKSVGKAIAKTRRVAAPQVAAVPTVNTSTHPIRSLTKADGALVARLREICMALPEANERVSHGEPTWFAGKGKVFAMLDNHHHGSEHLGVWLPQPRGVQEQLLAAEPKRFFRPPYVGSSGWVGVVLDVRPDWKGVAQLVRESYVFVATAKLRALLLP
jgi:predicted DNA-binding protein (MmcQ/YjbR family)